jgi:sensor c-di-GMP phosphodiesterase-like protein
VALRDAGVDYGQGWHFGRPGAPEQLMDFYAVEDPAGAVADTVRTVAHAE